MEDRRAVRNTFQRGIPVEEFENLIPMYQGIPMDSMGAIPRVDPELQSQYEALQGMPMPGPGMVAEPSEGGAAKCVATTKKGAPCKAYAVADSDLCTGHTRSK